MYSTVQYSTVQCRTLQLCTAQRKIFRKQCRINWTSYSILGHTLLNSSRSESAIQASHALRGSQLRVFSSPSLRGPLSDTVEGSAVQDRIAKLSVSEKIRVVRVFRRRG
jgi:hypothetical protein